MRATSAHEHVRALQQAYLLRKGKRHEVDGVDLGGEKFGAEDTKEVANKEAFDKAWGAEAFEGLLEE